ncbi:MAG: hypothetical protein K2X29_07715 [Candidatus Obscuribacterales bacterium]|nr:hypothetical protein [Candidatus Obscuribacterales bacterium]
MQVAIDREYLLRTIANLETQMSEHDAKFAGNPKHENCLPRFKTAIGKLQEELSRVQLEKTIIDNIK